MDVFEAIEHRHSIRDFKADAVPRTVIERVVRAASLAPSAANEQPWQFYCCEGSTRAELGRIVAQATVHLSEYMDVLGPKRYEDAVQWYSSLGDAPVLIAVTCVTPDSDFSALTRHISVGAAVENLLLSATSEGLGACNITFSHWVKDEMAALLGVPEDQEIVTIIALGYPTDVPPAAPPKRTDVALWFD